MTRAPFRKRNWMAGEQEWKVRIPFHSTVFFLSLESCKCVVYSKINKSRMKKKKKKTSRAFQIQSFILFSQDF